MMKQSKTVEPVRPPRPKRREWRASPKLDLERLVWDCEYREAMRPYWRKAS